MIEARAVVLRAENGRAWLRVIDRQDGCGRCDEPGGCRAVRIAYSIRPPTEVFSLPDTLGVNVGERVAIRMADGAPLRGALASYGLGVLMLLAGALVGHLLAVESHRDLAAFSGGVTGLVAACVTNRLLHRSRRWRGALAMEMVRADPACTLGNPSH